MRNALSLLGDQVAAYLQCFPDEAQRLTHLHTQLRRGADVLSRRTTPGHVTASGFLVRRGNALTVLHPRLRTWMAPGGHVEAEETPADAALRETREEAGIEAVLHPWHRAHPFPFDIDVHPIPPNPARREPAHIHFDFCYLLRCSRRGTDAAELEVAWQPLEGLSESRLRDLASKFAALGAERDAEA